MVSERTVYNQKCSGKLTNDYNEPLTAEAWEWLQMEKRQSFFRARQAEDDLSPGAVAWDVFGSLNY